MKSKMAYNNKNNSGLRLAKSQRGISMLLFTIGLLIILLIGGLALDMSHAMLNKARLQNTVDSAALAAASVLEGSDNIFLAETVALDVFDENALAQGNSELFAAVDRNDVLVQFSATLEPFSPGAASGTAEYVRVIVEDFSMAAWLIQVWQRADGSRMEDSGRTRADGSSIPTKTVRASAVAGPSPTLGAVCDLVPLIICGDADAGGPYWGYQDEEVVVLKSGPGTCSESGDIGPGNFQLARLGGSGNDVVRTNLAGGYEGCALLDGTIETQTGVGAGPVAQGINTRLGDFSGPISAGDYKPDVITETSDTWVPQDGDISYNDTTCQAEYNGSPVTDSADLAFNYDEYEAQKAAGFTNNAPPVGEFDRRNLTVTIAQCDGDTGNSDLPILGFGCFFMLQEVTQKGTEAELYGEFVADCNAKGFSGPVPTDIPGPNTIQLYNDPDSKDS